jgi:hypothetical protein
MPFSDFKKHAVYTRALVDDLINTPYNWVKGRMVRPIHCFMDCLPINPSLDPPLGGWNGNAMCRHGPARSDEHSNRALQRGGDDRRRGYQEDNGSAVWR